MGAVLKFLLLALLVLWLLYSPAVRGKLMGKKPAPPPPPKPPSATPPATAPPDTMVACAHCGVHLPRGEAVFSPDGRVFCSAAHLRAGA